MRQRRARARAGSNVAVNLVGTRPSLNKTIVYGELARRLVKAGGLINRCLCRAAQLVRWLASSNGGGGALKKYGWNGDDNGAARGRHTPFGPPRRAYLWLVSAKSTAAAKSACKSSEAGQAFASQQALEVANQFDSLAVGN